MKSITYIVSETEIASKNRHSQKTNTDSVSATDTEHMHSNTL